MHTDHFDAALLLLAIWYICGDGLSLFALVSFTCADRQILIKNVYAEIDKKEVSLCTDRKCSKAIEVVLAHSPHKQIRAFLYNLRPQYLIRTNCSWTHDPLTSISFTTLWKDPYASRVFEKILDMFPKLIKEDTADNDAESEDFLKLQPSKTPSLSETFDVICQVAITTHHNTQTHTHTHTHTHSHSNSHSHTRIHSTLILTNAHHIGSCQRIDRVLSRQQCHTRRTQVAGSTSHHAHSTSHQTPQQLHKDIQRRDGAKSWWTSVGHIRGTSHAGTI